MEIESKRHAVVIVALLAALAFAAPAMASSVHTGHVRFPEPATEPSIGAPAQPADQVDEAEREVVVRYEPAAGKVILEVEVWAAARWGETLLETRGQIEPVAFGVGPECGSTPLEGTVES